MGMQGLLQLLQYSPGVRLLARGLPGLRHRVCRSLELAHSRGLTCHLGSTAAPVAAVAAAMPAADEIGAPVATARIPVALDWPPAAGGLAALRFWIISTPWASM